MNNNLQRAHEKRRQLAEGYAREMNQGGAQMLRLEDDYDDREIATAIEDPFISQRDLRVRWRPSICIHSDRSLSLRSTYQELHPRLLRACPLQFMNNRKQSVETTCVQPANRLISARR